jgi:hypothetical protein
LLIPAFGVEIAEPDVGEVALLVGQITTKLIVVMSAMTARPAAMFGQGRFSGGGEIVGTLSEDFGGSGDTFAEGLVASGGFFTIASAF